jgi:lipopolysaccharide transport system ATP-binding protein
MSSSDIAIRVDNLSKSYQLYDAPIARLKQFVLPKLQRGLGKSSKSYYQDFWALRDVSFEITRGEAVGIIGRNGAGKSTLLQIIAGTVTPTSGSIEVRGRVGAMLELGSGFNPEFTGRENAIISASLLGLSADQINARISEIEAFADIGNFIDQAVKIYSSGMAMRLAFAVQTVFEPEILIVDEALSVGDAFFQAKCMARLRQLISKGVTVLFVSHDSSTVRQLCDKAILLHHGEMIENGNPATVTNRYLQMEIEDRNTAAISKNQPLETSDDITSAPSEGGKVKPISVNERKGQSAPTLHRNDWSPALDYGKELFEKKAAFSRTGNRKAEFLNVQMIKDGNLCDNFDFGDTIILRQVVRFHEPLSNVNVIYKIRTPQGTDIVFGDTRIEQQIEREYLANQTYVFEWRMRLQMLHYQYCIMSALSHPPLLPGDDWQFLDVIPICYDFRVAPRTKGMIDGFVTWDNPLSINVLADNPAFGIHVLR